jgi:hypothetical protein
MIATNNSGDDYKNHTNDLLCEVGNNKYYFSALTTSLPELTPNRWAYKLDGNPNWLAPSAKNQVLKTNSSHVAEGEIVNVAFGAKIDWSTPACVYSGAVTITVVAN